MVPFFHTLSSFCFQQVDYILYTATPFLHSDNIEQPSSSTERVPVSDEVKYIVFKSSLLELFTHCSLCHIACTGKVAYKKGTFIAIRQSCVHCGHQRLWSSQPHIQDTPAGNILLSSAILFSGGTPGKILRVLSHMNIACFTARTFYNHQRRYLDPAVISVWKTKQSTLLDQCRASGVPLTIGGDGRADSPGHSAKYGSYGIIELATNKVIDIQLIQVIKLYVHEYIIVMLYCII